VRRSHRSIIELPTEVELGHVVHGRVAMEFTLIAFSDSANVSTSLMKTVNYTMTTNS
jgi:hypothetical protein